MNHLWSVALVGAGGALGTLLRYGAGRLMARLSKPSFYGTLLVNIVGSLAMGMLIGLGWSEAHRTEYSFTAVGVLGGLTTYSTLNVQKATMRTTESRKVLFIYLIATYAGGLLATAAGVGLGYVLG